jgi:hypothetical protein
MTRTLVYEVRPRRDHRGFDLISDALPFGGLWYPGKNAVNMQSDTPNIAVAHITL